MLADTHPFVTAAVPHAPEALLARARGGRPPRVALVNAGAPVPMEGLREACEAGLAEPILLGDLPKIAAAAEAIGWDIRPFRVVEAPGDTAAPRAAALAVAGEADAIMKGQIHSSTFLKGLLPSSLGLRDRGAVCGHVFHVTVPGSDRPLLLTDCALNVAPDVPTRQACLGHAVRLARMLGVERPKVGVLAPSEDVTASIPQTGEAAAIAAWAKGALRGACVEGPLALDLILSRRAALVKGVESRGRGRRRRDPRARRLHGQRAGQDDDARHGGLRGGDRDGGAGADPAHLAQPAGARPDRLGRARRGGRGGGPDAGRGVILVVNAGSSSVKVALFDPASGRC